MCGEGSVEGRERKLESFPPVQGSTGQPRRQRPRVVVLGFRITTGLGLKGLRRSGLGLKFCSPDEHPMRLIPPVPPSPHLEIPWPQVEDRAPGSASR